MWIRVAVCAAFAAAAVVVGVGRTSAAAAGLAVGAAVLVAAACVWRSSLSSGSARVGWALIGAGMASNAVGDVLWQIALTSGREPFGAWLDPFYLATYPLVAAGAWVLVRAGRPVPRDATVDGVIVAAFTALVIWQFVIVNPGLSASGSLADRVIAAAYPLAGTLMIPALVVAAAIRRRVTAGMPQVMAFGVAFMACDVLFAVIQGADLTALHGVSDASYVVAYGILAAGALAPRRARHAHVTAGGHTRFGALRLMLLGLCLVGAPLLAIVAPTFDYAFSAPAYAALVLAVSATVLVRLAGLVRSVADERARLRATESQLAHQAAHDALTGLPNRSSLIARLREALEHDDDRPTAGVAVLVVDLDNFKHANDSLGNRAADELLRAVGERIRGSVKATDTVARVGGDEFVVVARGAGDPWEAGALASRVLEELSGAYSLLGAVAHVAASIGVAVGGSDRDAEALLREADVALQRAKLAGGRCVRTFDEAMRAWADERTGIESGLRAALDDGRLAVLYQPRVDLATGRIRSVEALLRWPERPALPIARLIEVAERSGLIDDIGRMVLGTACADLARLDAEARGTGIAVAVNLSLRQLARAGVVESVLATVRAAGADPRRVIIELTETFLSREPERATALLSALRAHGMRIEIDDFGTGYSSLARLGDHPVDGLKIDRSFTAGIGTDGTAEELIGTVVGLARALGLEVTAEGIETPAQAEAVRRAGCDLGQGFLFARPVPYDELVRMLRAARPALPASAGLPA